MWLQKTYDDIRIVTQLIAKRAKGEEPMSRPQFEELKVAIEAIVKDAHDYYGGRPDGPFKAWVPQCMMGAFSSPL